MILDELPEVKLIVDCLPQQKNMFKIRQIWREAEIENENGELENIDVLKEVNSFADKHKLEQALLEINFISLLLEKTPSYYFRSLIAHHQNAFKEMNSFTWLADSQMFNRWLPRSLEKVEVSYINETGWEVKTDYDMNRNDSYQRCLNLMFPQMSRISTHYEEFKKAIYQLNDECIAYIERRQLSQGIEIASNYYNYPSHDSEIGSEISNNGVEGREGTKSATITPQGKCHIKI